MEQHGTPVGEEQTDEVQRIIDEGREELARLDEKHTDCACKTARAAVFQRMLDDTLAAKLAARAAVIQ